MYTTNQPGEKKVLPRDRYSLNRGNTFVFEESELEKIIEDSKITINDSATNIYIKANADYEEAQLIIEVTGKNITEATYVSNKERVQITAIAEAFCVAKPEQIKKNNEANEHWIVSISVSYSQNK